MSYYARVSRSDNDEPVQLPLEDDGTLLYSTLSMVFTGATGIKYIASDNGAVKSLYYHDGAFYSPPEGWIYNFVCTYPTGEDANKRRISEPLENPTPNKTAKMEDNSSDLIVLDLPFSVQDEEFRNYFSQYGAVASATVKTNPFTKQSRGFGFVRFENPEVQNSVLEMEHSIGGRKVNVKIPKSKKKQDPFAKGKLFVSNLSEGMTEAVVKEYFQSFGEVSHVFVPKKPAKKFCFVTFAEPEVARTVCESGDHKINDHAIKVAPADQDRHGQNFPHWGPPGMYGFYPFGFYGPSFNQYYNQFNKARRHFVRHDPRMNRPPRGTNPNESPEDALHRLRIEKMKLDGAEKYEEVYDYADYMKLNFSEIDFSAAYTDRDCLVLSGNIPEVRARENCVNIVRNILKWKAYKDMEESDIIAAHRLGNRIENPDRRSIIVKFKDPTVVPKIVAACKHRKQDFYITEPLTLLKRTISYVLRKAKDKFEKVTRVRLVSQNVTVDLAATADHGVREVIINSRDELNEFLKSELNSSVVECCDGACPFTERDIV